MSRSRMMQIARGVSLPVLASLASLSLLAGSAAAVAIPASDQDDVMPPEQSAQTAEEPAETSAESEEPEADAAAPVEESTPDFRRADAAALQSNGCSYADPGTGSHAETLCWLDFSGFSFNGSDTAVQEIEIDLGAGRILTANLVVSGGAVAAEGFPTWGDKDDPPGSSGAYLGRLGKYMGVTGKPALYQTGDRTTTTAKLDDIRVVGPNGENLSGFSILVADAESTDNDESISWTTDAGDFSVLPNSPESDYGNACSSDITLNGSSAECIGSDTSAEGKTGTAMLYVDAPADGSTFHVTQVMVGGGKQAIAFAVMFATARAEIEVEDRIDGTGDLTVELNAQQLPEPITATIPASGPDAVAETGVQELLMPGGTAARITFAAVGEELFDSYTQWWVCERSNPDQPDDPWRYEGSEPPRSDQSTLAVGEAISCKVTLTPPYLTLEKTVIDEYSGSGLGPQAWLLSAAGTTNIAPQPGGTQRQPVAVGEYELIEAADPDVAETAGFDLDGWECAGPDASPPMSGERVTIPAGADVTCIATNRALPGAVAWSKVDAEDTSQPLAGSTWTLVGPGEGPDAQEIAVADCESGTCEGPDKDPEAGGFLVEDLPWGTYTLRETSAPEGYAGGAEREFTITGSTAREGLVLAPIENDRILGSVTWTKVDEGDPQTLLGGSEWVLSGPEGDEATDLAVEDCLEAPCTGPDQNPNAGEFRIEDLVWGTYTLTETTAPPGYRLGAEGTFEVGPAAGGDVKLEWDLGAFENAQQPPLSLPLTGGLSSSMFWLIGSGMLAGAAVLSAVLFGRRRSA